METDSVHAVERFAGLHLFFRQPFLVRKGKLQFVTIKLCMLGTQDRQDFFHLNLANTGQVVDNLFLFVFQLSFVGQMLPFTSTANTEMFTERNRTFFCILMKCNRFPFSITVLFTC